MVLLVLIVHWLVMHMLVAWWCGEANLAHGQSPSTAATDNAVFVDDGWRRTSQGWEYIRNDTDVTASFAYAPSLHIAAAQIWPAAIAGCILVLILCLPDKNPLAEGR